MGTIERIRQISPYAFIAFAVIFIAFMVLSDNITTLTSSGGESSQTAAIAEINGEKIYYKDYEERVKTRVEQMRNNPQSQGQDVDEQAIRNQVWNEMLDEVLLKQAGEKFGIAVTDEEVADILIENPPDFLKQSFTDTAGNFNKQLYLELITNPEQLIYYTGQNPEEMTSEEKAQRVNSFRNELVMIGDYLKIQKLNEAMSNVVSIAYAVSSPSYIQDKYIADNSSANINYIYLPISNITDSVKVSDDEVKKYYDNNKSSFEIKESRKVKTLAFIFQPSQEDSARANNRIQRIVSDITSVDTKEEKDSIFSVKLNEYEGKENDWALIQDINPQVTSIIGNAEVGSVLGPIAMLDGTHFLRVDGRRKGAQEVVKASHILITFNDNKDSAKAAATKILAEAKKGNFAELATKYSEDKGSAMQGGDLGYFGKGRMVPEFEQAAFNTPVGSISGLVASQFGYHIIKVTDKKSEELKYSDIVISPIISGATKNNIKRDAFAAMKQIQDGANIDSLATKLNMMCDESPAISKRRPYQNSMALTNQIYEAKLGEVLEPREINNKYVLVCQVSDVKKDGIGTLEDVREQIISKITKIKKLDITKAKAQEVYHLVKSKGSLENLDSTVLPKEYNVQSAMVNNNGSIQGAGQDFTATSYIFSRLSVGKINEPVRCENAYFIFEIKDRKVPSKEQVATAKDMTKDQYSRNLFDTWFNKFREDAKIVDKRSKYYGDY